MIDRRQFLGGSAAVVCGLGLAACGGDEASDDPARKGSGDDAQKAKLIVFAAASMTESLTKAGDEFMSENQGYGLLFNFDSSGTLKTQIQEGADCDVFIPAGQKQMNALDAEAEKDNDEGLDFVDHATRFDILENKVALVVPEGNPKKIIDFNDLIERLRSGEILLSMGNSDVPVGQYTQKILAYYELDEEALSKDGCVTYGTNVKEVASQVSEGAVDCGVIYKTDAFSAGLAVVDEATKEMCGQVIYPAAVLKGDKEDAAQDFLAYLQTDAAMTVFESVGFSAA